MKNRQMSNKAWHPIRKRTTSLLVLPRLPPNRNSSSIHRRRRPQGRAVAAVIVVAVNAPSMGGVSLGVVHRKARSGWMENGSTTLRTSLGVGRQRARPGWMGNGPTCRPSRKMRSRRRNSPAVAPQRARYGRMGNGSASVNCMKIVRN